MLTSANRIVVRRRKAMERLAMKSPDETCCTVQNGAQPHEHHDLTEHLHYAVGLNTTIAIPPTNEMTTAPTNAAQLAGLNT